MIATKKKTRATKRRGGDPFPPEFDGAEFDSSAADKAVKFIESLQHIKGSRFAQSKFILAPWQRDIVRAVFGWKRPDRTRVYRVVYLEVPRKNGKSTFAAAIALYLLFLDGEAGAEIYSAAGTREQARAVYDTAKAMVEHSAMLSKRATIFKSQLRIVVESTNSYYRPIAADDDNSHGFNAHGIIFDELHTQPDRNLWDVMQTGRASRDQPLTIAITTAGYDRTSICWEIHQYAIAVRDGVKDDPTFLPVIFAADEKDNWTSEETWKKANPNYGVSVNASYLQEECAKAQQNPAYENTFKRLHLNIWTEQSVRAIPMDAWRACKTQVDYAALRGRRCFGGLDLSSTRDVTAWVMMFPLDDGKFLAIPRFWIPSSAVSVRAEQDRRIAATLAEDGWITKTPGNEVEYSAIVEQIMADAETFDIAGIGYDPTQATGPMQALVNEGFAEDKRHPMRQNWETYHEPFDRLLSSLPEKKFQHPGHPALDWMAANTATRPNRANYLYPDKAASGDKIDGICALLMAMRLWISAELAQPAGSIYETRDLLTLGSD